MSALRQVDPRDYHSDPRLKCDRSNILSQDSWMSKSVLWELNDSSLYRWRFHPREYKPTAAMQWGSLIDCLTTTPELANTTLALSPYDSFRTGDAKAWRDEQLEAGRIIIRGDELDDARIAARMLLETHPISSQIFAASKSQVIVGAKVEGVNFKGLLDLAPEGEDYLADLKTTNDFTLAGFGKTVASYGYHVQAGLYLALWNASHPDDQRKRFKIIWQDSSPPYEVCVQELGSLDITCGMDYATYLVRKLITATKTNRWPMLGGDKVTMLTRPTWASISEDDKMQQEVAAP